MTVLMGFNHLYLSLEKKNRTNNKKNKKKKKSEEAISKSSCETIVMKMRFTCKFIIMQIKFVFIRKGLQEDSF